MRRKSKEKVSKIKHLETFKKFTQLIKEAARVTAAA